MRNGILLAAALVLAGFASVALHAQNAPTPATKPASLDERLRRTAAISLEAVVQKEQIAPLTPEMLELHHLWAQRLLDAEMALAKNKQERVDAAQRQLNRMNDLHAKIMTRLDVDADKITIGAADYYVAESEVLLARESR